MRNALFGIMVLGAVGLSFHAAQPPAGPSTALPVFRSGVELVQVDASVLDKDRKPVLGLTAADFTVREDGKPRPIASFQLVELPPPAPATGDATGVAAWTRSVAPDVESNAVPPQGRLVVIMFDWSIRFQDQQTARKIATDAVDALGPGDEAAVVFTSGSANAGTPQGFTADHARLLEAIHRPIAAAAQNPPNGPFHDVRNFSGVMLEDPEGYESGDCHCRLCVLDAVGRVADLVRDVPGRRKELLFIGDYFQGYEPISPTPPSSATPLGTSPFQPGVAPGRQSASAFPPMSTPLPTGSGVCAGELNVAREKMQRATGLANLRIDVLDPAGNTSAGSDPMGGTTQWQMKRQDDLHIMPDMTGGRTVVNTNAPEELVRAILAESQSYYLLGFEPASNIRDGKMHTIDVTVKRPGLSVRARTGYLATDERAAAEAPASATPLAASLDSVLPRSGIPLTLSAVALATPGDATPATVALIIGVREPAVAAGSDAARTKESETVLAGLFDTNGRSGAKTQETLTVTLPPSSNGELRYEVIARLPAVAGRYEVRAGVDITPDRRGTVQTFVEVPDFAKAPFSVSGLAIGVTPPHPTAGSDLVKPLLPVIPTARRTFQRDDQVTSFVRLYQGGRNPHAAVSVLVRITDVHDRDVATETMNVPIQRFERGGSADLSWNVPIRSLEPGDYLLRVEARRGNEPAIERNARFTVAGNAPASSGSGHAVTP